MQGHRGWIRNQNTTADTFSDAVWTKVNVIEEMDITDIVDVELITRPDHGASS